MPFVVYIPAFYCGCVLITSLLAGRAFEDAVTDLFDASSIVILLGIIFLGLVIDFLITTFRWYRATIPRELRALITAEDLKIYGDKMGYSTRWSNVTSLSESEAAYMVKVKGPFVRLPKRGFTSSQMTLFEELAKAGLSTDAYKLARD